MNSSIFLTIALAVFFIIGIWFVYFMVRVRGIKFKKLDDKTLLLKLPFLGTIETEEPNEYKGIFVKEVSDVLGKMKFFQNFLDPYLMLEYANNYNLNYIGTEGDNIDGTWSNGRLAYNTLSYGHNGGYNIYLNPNLDREAVSKRLSEQLGLEIKPEELYTFLFLHEIGHTRKAGNECYVTAMVSHSLSGGRRAARRRRELKNLYIRSEKFADDFAIKELIKIRKKGMN